MKKRNDTVISKPFAVFVVIGIGIALTAYVVIGIVSVEIKAHRISQERRVVSSLNESVKVEGRLQSPRGSDVENSKKIEFMEGEVLSIENGIVTIESKLGGEDLTEVQILVNKEDREILEVGANVSVILSDDVLVSDIEDGAISAEKFVVVEDDEEEAIE